MPHSLPPTGRRFFSFICSLLVTFCYASFAQQAPPPPSPELAPGPTVLPPSTPTLRITTREVLLDVLVIDKAGQPVTGLKASDFKVAEEGEPQSIRRVDEHHPMSATDMEKLAQIPVLPPNVFTNYTPVRNTNASIVILLDAMDSPMGAQMVMRQQLINYLKHMQPGPPVAIFQLDTQMRLIQGFTSDPKVLLAAAESKRDMPSMARPTAAPRNYSADAVYRRTLMENLRGGMQMMGSYLAGYPGRKNLIWFTGRVPMTNFGMGFGSPFRDRLVVSGGTGDEASELTDVLAVSRVAVYPVDTRGLVGLLPPPSESQGRISPMAANNGFYDHANMDQVAEQTGGKAYYNTNDFTRVITDVVNTGSSYYTLAYATTNTKWKGEFRKIKITVDRPNVTVQHKEGYYAYSLEKREQSEIAALEKHRAETAAQPTANARPSGAQPAADADAGDNSALVHPSVNGGFGAAMALGAIPPTEIVFVARVEADANAEKLGKGSPMPADNFLKPEWQHKPFRNYTIYFNTDAHRFRLSPTPDGGRHDDVEFVVLVYAQNGEMVNSLVTKESFTVNAAQYRKLIASGLPAKMEIAVPAKGNFFLRLGVHDLNGNQVGSLEIPVDQVKLGNIAATQKP